jgi:hypothetical protein
MEILQTSARLEFRNTEVACADFPAPGGIVADALPRGGRKVKEIADLCCPSRETLFD